MKELGMLKFEDLYEQQCVTLIHDIIKKRSPASISKLVSIGKNISSYNLRAHKSDPLQLRKPNLKSKTGSNSFCLKGPLLWNDLPQNLKDIKRKEIFKVKLKRHFLEQYKNHTECNNPKCTDKRHHIPPD